MCGFLLEAACEVGWVHGAVVTPADPCGGSLMSPAGLWVGLCCCGEGQPLSDMKQTETRASQSVHHGSDGKEQMSIKHSDDVLHFNVGSC